MKAEITGRSKGGRARMEGLSPEEKRELALKMVEIKAAKKAMPKASHRGEIVIGDAALQCAVLDNGTRVISESAIHSNFGVSGGKVRQIRAEMEKNLSAPIPLFLASKALEPFIFKVFGDGHLGEIQYNNNGQVSVGYDATILPKVCEVWLMALDAGVLQESQKPKAKKAELMIRGLARVGIIALVDEATGYQKDRAKDALAKILEAFVSKELQPYLRTFPADYYEHLFRLYGIPYPPKDKKPQWKPSFFGHITNDVIYGRLAPELLPELKKAATKIKRQTRLHQWLTPDTGHPKLREHLASIVTILKLSKTPDEFKQNVNAIHPRYGDTLALDFNPPKD